MKPRRGYRYCRQEGRFGSKPGWLRQSISGVAPTNCAALTRTCFSKSSQHADWPKGARRSMSSGFRESPSASASRYHKGEQLENVDSVRGERRGVIDRDRYAAVQFLFLEILPKWETSLDVYPISNALHPIRCCGGKAWSNHQQFFTMFRAKTNQEWNLNLDASMHIKLSEP